MTEFNVWGTDVSMIDADEFCVRCEHATPGHYTNCDAVAFHPGVETRKAHPVYPGATAGRSGDIERRADGTWRVVLWEKAERVADGGQIAKMARRTVVATERGADRIVQAWLKAGR